MANDNVTVEIGGQSPEEVAYKLLKDLVYLDTRTNWTVADYLALYSQCLDAVRGRRAPAAGSSASL